MSKVALRIALVAPFPPPAGGMANQAQQLEGLLVGEGLSVLRVRTNEVYWPSWIGHVPVVRAVFRLIPFLFRVWTALGRVDIVHLLANSGWSWHLGATPVIWLAKLRRKPVILNYRGGKAAEFFASSLRWVSPSLRQVARIIVPSQFLAVIFSEIGFNTTIVPNIVDLSRFNPSHHRERDLLRPRLLVARNLEALYDNATAIRAFQIVYRRYPGASLYLAGSGAELMQLKKLAKDLELEQSVFFIGQVDNTKIHEIYAETDVAINPSRADNMPISLLEAFASGVPVVSTAVGGVPYMIEDGKTGLLVEVGNHVQMSEAVMKLLEDEHLHARIAMDAREQSKKYAWANIKAELLMLYNEVSEQNAH
jgi:L-malate glycosyltransferase